MAPHHARKTETSNRGGWLLSALALVALLCNGAAAAAPDPFRQLQTATTLDCSPETRSCTENDVCNNCIISFEAEGLTCTDYDYDKTNECQVRGVAYCCGAEGTGDPDECLVDASTLELWACLMEENGCNLSDMPCFQQDFNGVSAQQSGASRGAAAAGAAAAAATALALALTVTGGGLFSL